MKTSGYGYNSSRSAFVFYEILAPPSVYIIKFQFLDQHTFLSFKKRKYLKGFNIVAKRIYFQNQKYSKYWNSTDLEQTSTWFATPSASCKFIATKQNYYFKCPKLKNFYVSSYYDLLQPFAIIKCHFIKD